MVLEPAGIHRAWHPQATAGLAPSGILPGLALAGILPGLAPTSSTRPGTRKQYRARHPQAISGLAPASSTRPGTRKHMPRPRTTAKKSWASSASCLAGDMSSSDAVLPTSANRSPAPGGAGEPCSQEQA
jgi:hypothetical protein